LAADEPKSDDVEAGSARLRGCWRPYLLDHGKSASAHAGSIRYRGAAANACETRLGFKRPLSSPNRKDENFKKKTKGRKRNMPIQTIKKESDGSGGELPIWLEIMFLKWRLKQT